MLQPCDLSLSYTASDGESAVTLVLSGSEVTVHLVEAVVRTLTQVRHDTDECQCYTLNCTGLS